jgi:hypothetical protein
MNMQAATAPGRAYAQMGKDFGDKIGSAIKQYGLNKVKRAKLTDKIESRLRLNPSLAQRLIMTGDEGYDKKNTTYMEKLSQGELGLKGLESLDSAMATINELDIQKQQEQTAALNNKLLEEKLVTSVNARGAIDELNKQKKAEKNRIENTYNAYGRQLDDLQKKISNGEKYENLSVQDRLILGNSAGITNRTIDLEDLIYDPTKQLDFMTAQQEFENLKKQGEKTDKEIKMGELELGEKETEIARTPDFTDRNSALASTSDLPEGVSADIKKFKDGFNVEYKYKAKEFTDIPSVPGYPNYKKVGGFLYEADPKTKTLRKLDPEDFGEKSKLLQNAIKTLTTKDVEQYGLAKFRGVRNDDGDYDFEDPASGETITIPFNQDLESRLIYLDELHNKLKTQIDLDLTIP